MDAIATPFVQGKLREENLSFVVDSVCADSGRPIQVEIDRDLHYRVPEGDADLRIFVPIIDVERLDDPSIIDAF